MFCSLSISIVQCVIRLIIVTSLITCLDSSRNCVYSATLHSVDGKILQGKLIQISQNQFTLQTKSGLRTVPGAEIIRVDFDHPKLSQSQAGMVLLANDDRILGKLLHSEDDSILVRLISCPEAGDLKIPLETIQSAFFQWPSSQQSRTQLIKKLSQQTKNSDRFHLKNGDSLVGEFLNFDSRIFRFESRAGETSVPREGIRFFQFSPELINFPQPDQLRYRVELTEGTRMVVSALTLDRKMVKAKTLFGPEIQFHFNRLDSIIPIGGKAISLSELEPSEYQFTPYFSQKWNWYRNRNVLKGPLIVGGKEYSSGLGTHSASELHYQLDGKYAAFQTEVGIDDSTHGAGNVIVTILVDQRVVFQQAVQGTEKKTVVVPRINLLQANELILKVDFGKNADIQDHVDWCRPILILK